MWTETTTNGRPPTAEERLTAVRRLWSVVIIWLGAALRLRGLFANTFHADEALFASWARLIAVWRDPLLITQ